MPLPTQHFEGGTVAWSRGGANVSQEPDLSTDPGARCQQKAPTAPCLSRHPTCFPAAGRHAIPVLVSVAGVPNQIIIHIRLQGEQNMSFTTEPACMDCPQEGKPGLSSLGFRDCFLGTRLLQNCKRTTPYWCRHNAGFSKSPLKYQASWRGRPHTR